MRRVALGTGSEAICQREHVGNHLRYAIAIRTKTHLASRTIQTPNTNVGSEWTQTRGVASYEALGRPARTPLLAGHLLLPAYKAARSLAPKQKLEISR